MKNYFTVKCYNSPTFLPWILCIFVQSSEIVFTFSDYSKLCNVTMMHTQYDTFLLRYFERELVTNEGRRTNVADVYKGNFEMHVIIAEINSIDCIGSYSITHVHLVAISCANNTNIFHVCVYNKRLKHLILFLKINFAFG